MFKVTMKDLEDCFESAVDEDCDYVAVKIQMQGFEKPEIIINQRENFQTKLAYYKKAYNDDLALKTFSGIKIVGFTFGDDWNEIECYLVD